MANWILSDEFQQRWIPKVVSSLEDDMLVHEMRVLMQVRTQASDIACIDEVYRAPKCCVFNPLFVWQIQSIGERWFFKVSLQSRPAGKSIFAGDCELRITEAELGVEDFSVTGPSETRVKFPDPLGYSRSSGFVLLE